MTRDQIPPKRLPPSYLPAARVEKIATTPDMSGYDPAVKAEKHRMAMAPPLAKTDEAIAAEDAKVSAWSASAFIGAAAAMMGVTAVCGWARRLLGRKS